MQGGKNDREFRTPRATTPDPEWNVRFCCWHNFSDYTSRQADFEASQRGVMDDGRGFTLYRVILKIHSILRCDLESRKNDVVFVKSFTFCHIFWTFFNVKENSTKRKKFCCGSTQNCKQVKIEKNIITHHQNKNNEKLSNWKGLPATTLNVARTALIMFPMLV